MSDKKNLTTSQGNYPSKLFVEPTTRCNLRCEMCVKQAHENEIQEGDLAEETFAALSDAFDHLDTLIFSGIGEPLLHPELEQFMAVAKKRLPAQSRVGLQTNGFLLDQARAESLLTAGLNVISLSMDAASPELFQQIRKGGEIAEFQKAFQSVKLAKSAQGHNSLKLGIEIVLMKKNLAHLPATLAWAAEQGAEFAIVTHLMAYDSAIEPEVAYSLNTDASHQLFSSWQAKAEERGLDLKKYLNLRRTYLGNYRKLSEQQELVSLGEQMIDEAYSKNIPFHSRNLLAEDTAAIDEMAEIFEEARRTAQATGLELTLPALYPQFERKCSFVEDGSAFITWDGLVHPCYFLWHQYARFLNGRKQYVISKSFGDLSKNNIFEIWNNDSYISYRQQVTKYDYPYCENCNLGPCNLILSKEFEYDCYIINVRCGSCPWCMGLLQCLQ